MGETAAAQAAGARGLGCQKEVPGPTGVPLFSWRLRNLPGFSPVAWHTWLELMLLRHQGLESMKLPRTSAETGKKEIKTSLSPLSLVSP